MQPIWKVLRDLERASRLGTLTPSFLDAYSDVHGERVTALYALVAKNFLTVSHEEGRNDHVLTEWEGTVDVAATLRALDEQSQVTLAQLRRARQDGRPHSLRKPTKNAFFALEQHRAH